MVGADSVAASGRWKRYSSVRSSATAYAPSYSSSARVSASIASFDFLYLGELARRGLVAPTVRPTDDDEHLGLGLYIARLIAEGHGGSISAENTDGGVVFHVHLPRA